MFDPRVYASAPIDAARSSTWTRTSAKLVPNAASILWRTACGNGIPPARAVASSFGNRVDVPCGVGRIGGGGGIFGCDTARAGGGAGLSTCACTHCGICRPAPAGCGIRGCTT